MSERERGKSAISGRRSQIEIKLAVRQLSDTLGESRGLVVMVEDDPMYLPVVDEACAHSPFCRKASSKDDKETP